MPLPVRRTPCPRHRKAESRKGRVLELQTKIAQRDSFSLSKTSFSPERVNRGRGPSASYPSGSRPKTRRRVKGTVETEKETSRRVAAPSKSGSDQEGSVKGIQLRRRMLRSIKIRARSFGVRRCLW